MKKQKKKYYNQISTTHAPSKLESMHLLEQPSANGAPPHVCSSFTPDENKGVVCPWTIARRSKCIIESIQTFGQILTWKPLCIQRIN